MRALTWQGKRNVAVEDVPDPRIQEPTDAIIEVTSTGICGSDLHLYEVLGPFMDAGDVIGHEPMGIVREVGSEVTHIRPGDRVVVPFTISCGRCWMCQRGLQSQCETTQVREQGSGAALFGYSRLYGSVPGGQAELLRVPHADYGPVKVPHTGPDEQWLFLSDVVPTAWQGVQYANVPDGGTLAVLGLGPIGQLAARIGVHLGYRVFGVDPVPERRAMAARHGIEVLDADGGEAEVLRERTGGRGPDAVLDAVGMEAHASPVGHAAHTAVGLAGDATQLRHVLSRLAHGDVDVRQLALLGGVRPHGGVALGPAGRALPRGAERRVAGVLVGGAAVQPAGRLDAGGDEHVPLPGADGVERHAGGLQAG